MSRGYNEILTHTEIQHLLERNNRLDLCHEPDVLFTRDDGRKRWTWGDLPTPNEGKPACDLHHHRWLRQLHSKTWRVQPKGAKVAYVVERPVRSRGEMRFVPLNSRA